MISPAKIVVHIGSLVNSVFVVLASPLNAVIKLDEPAMARNGIIINGSEGFVMFVSLFPRSNKTIQKTSNSQAQASYVVSMNHEFSHHR
jgi:hypothetical protein